MNELQKKRKQAVRDAADRLTVRGFTVYINLDTWEVDDWYNDSLMLCSFDDDDESLVSRPNWEHLIEIGPLDSNESFEIMENFVLYALPKGMFRDMMKRVLEGSKPFANFNHQIHCSKYREEWFAFRLERLEEYVKTLVVLELTPDGCTRKDKEEFYPSNRPMDDEEE